MSNLDPVKVSASAHSTQAWEYLGQFSFFMTKNSVTAHNFKGTSHSSNTLNDYYKNAICLKTLKLHVSSSGL